MDKDLVMLMLLIFAFFICVYFTVIPAYRKRSVLQKEQLNIIENDIIQIRILRKQIIAIRKEINLHKLKTMKTYILLKDLPSQKAGAEYIEDGSSKYKLRDNIHIGFKHIDSFVIENTPEWFKLKEEKEFTKSQLRDIITRMDPSDLTSLQHARLCGIINSIIAND